MIFNLAKYFLGIQKEAMGFPTYKSQPIDYIWDYEELANAPANSTDQRIMVWNDLVANAPSIKSVLKEAERAKRKYLYEIKRHYGMNSEQAKHIYKIYIGYGNSRGAYIYGVGPYFSQGGGHGLEHVKQEAVGRFGYYDHRFGNATPEEITKNVNNTIKKITDQLGKTTNGEPIGLNLDISDFKLIDRISPQELSDGTIIPGETIKEINNLGIKPLISNPTNDPEIEKQNAKIHKINMKNNPEATKFYNERPFISTANIKLNGKGFDKVMQSLMGPWYEEVLTEQAATKMRAEGVDLNSAREQIVNQYLSDEGTLRDFYNKVRQKYTSSVKSKDPRAMNIIGLGYPTPPSFKDKQLTSRYGQNIPTKCPSNEDMFHSLEFRKKILKMIQDGVTDVNEIDEIINSGLSAKYKMSTEKIAYELNKIANMRRNLQSEGLKGTYNEIGKKIDNLYNELKKNENGKASHGFNDFETAFEMFALHKDNPLTLKPIDYNETQVKPLSDLNKLNKAKEDEVGDVSELVAPEQMALDIKDDMPQQEKVKTETEEEFPIQEVPLQGKTPSKSKKKTPSKQKALQQSPIVEEEEEDSAGKNFLDLLAYTVKNLIKVARELDDEGKEDAAEEVHKVIRKYQKRII